RALEARRVRSALDLAKSEMARGRYGTARQVLAELSASRSARGEVDYQLGLCELYRRRPDAALAAWGRVPPGTPFAARAAVQRAMLTMDAGQFTRAEAILTDALRRETGPDTAELCRALEILYHLEGRTHEQRRAIVA